jgi:hypothetical protein
MSESEQFGGTVERLLRIEELCDRYEDRLKVGQRQSVGAFLRAAGIDPDRAEPDLVRELNRVAAAYGTADPGQVRTVSANSVRGDGPGAEDTAVGPGDTHSADAPAVPGYRLLGELARGGMGLVYRAHDPSIGRDVAIKVLHDRYRGNPSAARRFVAESQLTGRLQHPGVPPVFEVGTLADGSPFLAMKLIDGRTLDDVLNGSARPAPAFLVAAFEHICQAVAYAHSRRIVHRDLKPANVMVGAFGEVQVMDWGLAKELGDGRAAGDGAAGSAIERELAAGSTRPGSVLGTPAYMAPEAARGEIDALGPRSDVFGLGGILCAILTGRPPFVGDTAEGTHQLAAQGRVQNCFDRLDASGADLELVALCKGCLAPERTDRPADADAVAKAVAALRAAADERARRAERDRAAAEAKAAEQRKRRRLRTALVLCIGFIIAGILGVDQWRKQEASDRRTAELSRQLEEERRAAEERERATSELLTTLGRAMMPTILTHLHSRGDAQNLHLELQIFGEEAWPSHLRGYNLRFFKPGSQDPDYQPKDDDIDVMDGFLKDRDKLEDPRYLPERGQFVYYGAIRAGRRSCCDCHTNLAEVGPKLARPNLARGDLMGVIRIQFPTRWATERTNER